MERKPFNWKENFSGNWKILETALKNPETVWVYDVDGITADSPKVVLENFQNKFGVKVSTAEINTWNYLSEKLKTHGFNEETIKHAEDGWFDPEILLSAPRELFIKPVIRKTIKYYGAERNFVLTSRMPHLKNITFEWYAREVPEIPKENILMNINGNSEVKTSAEYKVNELKKLAVKAPWVIFIDDHVGFAQAVVEDGIPNCLVICAPQGTTPVNIVHERLFVIGRYPFKEQGMYTLYHALLVAHS